MQHKLLECFAAIAELSKERLINPVCYLDRTDGDVAIVEGSNDLRIFMRRDFSKSQVTVVVTVVNGDEQM